MLLPSGVFGSHIIEALSMDYDEELPAPVCCPVTKRGKYPGDRRR